MSYNSSAQQWVEVGALIRGQFRRELFRAGIEFTEQKSFTTSIFRIGNKQDYIRVARWVRDIQHS